MLIAGVGFLGTGYNVDSGCWLPMAGVGSQGTG
jgi:hypothetical protein